MTIPENVTRICDMLAAGLSAEYGTPRFPAVGEYVYARVEPRHFMRYVPVVAFTRDGDAVCFIVTETDPNERVYKRTARFDIVYFSEDVPDDEQDRIYARDRSVIDAFCAWLARFDAQSSGQAKP